MTLTQIENNLWIGTNGPDNVTLTSEQTIPQQVLMLDGNDTVIGSEDNNLISAGKGDDDLSGAGGDDQLFGDRDHDVLNSNLGNDFLRGGKGNDYMGGGDGNDTLIGDADLDLYMGGLGQDVFVLRADQSNQIQSLTVAQTLFPGVPEAVILPDAIIGDFNISEDSIGLTGGITKADLIFENYNTVENLGLTTDLVLPIIETFIPNVTNLVGRVGLTPAHLDPDGNGATEGTAIYINVNDELKLLGLLLNVVPNDLAKLPDTRFISI